MNENYIMKFCTCAEPVVSVSYLLDFKAIKYLLLEIFQLLGLPVKRFLKENALTLNLITKKQKKKAKTKKNMQWTTCKGKAPALVDQRTKTNKNKQCV